MDRILALRVLRDFRIELLAAYVDLRKAIDSVNRDVLCRILALRGIPPKLVKLISGLYSGYWTKSAMRCDGTISDYFPVNTGVRQGCGLAATLFNTFMDYVLGRISEKLYKKNLEKKNILTVRKTRTYSRRQPKFLRRHLSR